MHVRLYQRYFEIIIIGFVTAVHKFGCRSHPEILFSFSVFYEQVLMFVFILDFAIAPTVLFHKTIHPTNYYLICISYQQAAIKTLYQY